MSGANKVIVSKDVEASEEQLAKDLLNANEVANKEEK